MNNLPDLHRHLDGSIRPSTLAELADSLGKTVPPDLLFAPKMGLSAALSKFAFTLSLLQSADVVKRVASEICEDAAADGVSSLEIRFAPQLHKSAPMSEIVDAALEGCARRAGIILCALYGDSPESVMELVKVASNRSGVVGLDLAGAPYPGCPYKMVDYRYAFHEAINQGLGTTVHAGEGRPPAEIAQAILQLRADRIGHGTTLLQDAHVLDLVLRNDITIEACLTSNLHVDAVASIEEFPLPRWLELGVKACICTDNTLLSNVSSSSEHELALTIPGMTLEYLNKCIDNGHQAVFER
jgi:adenosine deaminase